MRVPGYCERCHRFRQVSFSSHALAMASLHRGTVFGTCQECEDGLTATTAPRKVRGGNRNGGGR